MKRPLLLAAVLAAAPLMAGTAKAEPLQMFNVNAPAAGVMTFSGTGTANYNQSLGTNNSLNLGSSTNVGVSASASSTQDYESAGYAELNLDATSRMQQTIGTATTAFNASTAAESASRAADTTATSTANSSKYGHTWGRDYNAEYSRESGWALNTDVDNTNPDHAYTRTTEVGVEYASEAEYTASSQAHWQAGWDSEYNSAYETAYSTAQSSATQENEGTSGTGVIVANFTTTEKGTSGSAAGALDASFAAQASAAADLVSNDSSSLEWNAAYNAAYSGAYAAADAKAERESISNVEIQGLGSIADINSLATSTFTAESTLLTSASRPDTVGNGNASAGASLATSSFASAANATTASGFMQAFTGGGLEADVIVGITGSTTGSGGEYNVTTAPGATTTTTYTTDMDGVVQ